MTFFNGLGQVQLCHVLMGPQKCPPKKSRLNRFLGIHSLKLTYPLKNDGWKTILSFWEGMFSWAMLVSGMVSHEILGEKQDPE